MLTSVSHPNITNQLMAVHRQEGRSRGESVHIQPGYFKPSDSDSGVREPAGIEFLSYKLIHDDFRSFIGVLLF